ncbi:hypothetical protein LSM04_007216 [Trypanosoma melophagium]|uniref:uncharacterized protein n=1 Tax=Trypanosoma melophagium TaxID=715481 RepID=UPI00351A0F3D|nr:hypothetical protein LSM04_007216 [Trypanosoma melophagium]
MSLLDDDDSSTYCSMRTPRSRLPSLSPERSTTGVQESQRILQYEFPPHKSSQHPSKEVFVRGTEYEKEGDSQKEEKHNELNDSWDTRKVLVATETLDSSPIFPDEAVFDAEKLESAVNTKEHSEALHTPTHHDESSSIEFVVDDTASHTSRSLSPSSIHFIRDPSVRTLREASMNNRQNNNGPPHPSEAIEAGKVLEVPVVNEVTSDNENENMIRKNVTDDNIRKTLEPKCNEEKMQKSSSLHKNSKAFSQEDLSDNRHQREHSSRRSSHDGSCSGRNKCMQKEIKHEKKICSKKYSADFEIPGFSRHAESSKRSSRNSSRENSVSRERRRQHHVTGRNDMTFEGIESRGGDTAIRFSSFSHDADRYKGMRSSHGVQLSPRRGKSIVVPHFTNHNRSHNTNTNTSMSRDSCTPIRHQRLTKLIDGVAIVSPALERLLQNKFLESPLRVRHERKQELLSLLEEEMNVVREKVKECDTAMEEAMLRNPYERLYHMNNRRDRDERRTRILHYMKLKEARERLLAEDDETIERRRAQRRESARRRKEVFDRLYYTTPTRENNSRDVSRRSVRSESPPYVVDDAFFLRLYDEALESIAEKRERMRQAELEREQREVEDMLHARILAHLELHTSPRCARTPQQMEQRASSIQRKLLQDPARLREFLHNRKLTKKEEEFLAWRLSRQGHVDVKKLAEKKEQMELEGCTFHPKTNNMYNAQSVSLRYPGYTRSTAASARRMRKDEEGENANGKGERRSYSRTQQRACEQLYAKAKSMRERQKALVEEAQRAKKIAFLRSKLKEDHHFRRRVELDPSLAERYMASLVV